MKDFRIGDKVVFNNFYNGAKGEVVGIDLNERCKDRYLVKSGAINEECGWNYEEAKRNFDDKYDIEPYDGYAIWTDNIEKVKEVEEELKDCEYKDEKKFKFSLGQNVVCNGEECKVIGIDKTHKDNLGQFYLITTNIVDFTGELYKVKERFKNYKVSFLDNIPNDTKCRWVMEEELEPKSAGCDLSEEHIRTEFDKIKEQKKEIIKEMSKRALELTLEIKEIEAEIEKIKKEWHL